MKMANKSVVVAGLVVLLLAAGYGSYRLGLLPVVPKAAGSPTAVLTLQDLPPHYCASAGQVVLERNGTIVAASKVAVQGCRSMNFDRFLSARTQATIVFVKLPDALAFSVRWPPQDGQPFAYAPALGDVNGDNIINNVDGQLVTTGLFTADPHSSLDVDGDGTVTILDLTLVRLNQGVGVSRPDGKAWSSTP